MKGVSVAATFLCLSTLQLAAKGLAREVDIVIYADERPGVSRKAGFGLLKSLVKVEDECDASCPVGSYSEAGRCVLCPPGYFSAQPGASRCKQCFPG
ncbi:hypothetical protein WJX84_002197, partial [Apatococcus fuscideae]